MFSRARFDLLRSWLRITLPTPPDTRSAVSVRRRLRRRSHFLSVSRAQRKLVEACRAASDFRSRRGGGTLASARFQVEI